MITDKCNIGRLIKGFDAIDNIWYNFFMYKSEGKYSFKHIFNKIIFGLAITIFILLLIIFLTTDINSIKKAFSNINVGYLFAAIGLTVLYFILSPITTCILTKIKKSDIKMLDVYLIANTEHFFNGITPFATGGQPFQVYAYSRFDVKPSESTGILVMNFLINVAFINFFAIISIIIYPQLLQAVGNLVPLIIIGFVVNILAYLAVVLLACSKKVANFVVYLFTILAKIKFLNKFIVPVIPAFQKYCMDTQSAFKELWKHKGATLVCFFIRAITMLLYYAITFYILRAFNIKCGYEDLFFVICGTAFVIIGCVFIPTPGGSGGIEFAFTSIFIYIASGITQDVGASGMLLWRMLTYYGLMLISFFDYIILEYRANRRQKYIINQTMNMTETGNDDISEDNTENIVDNTNDLQDGNGTI